MKVLLIYPPISKFERYSSDLGHSGGRQIPLGIFYLGAYLRKYGHEVHVVDGEALETTAAGLAEQARQLKPGLVGLSATTVAFHRALETAREIKKILPETPIALGGPHITASWENALSYSEFDLGILGEGEASLLELVETLEGSESLEKVGGLVYKRDGRLTVNQSRNHISDIDDIPFPAYDLIPDLSVYNPPPSNYKRLPVANIITSRGCPNQCTFCGHQVFGRTLRQRSASNIVDEIEMLYKQHHVREIAFVDDTFTIKPERIIDLFDLLDSKGIRIPWTCMSRVNTVDFEILKYMRDHGCWHISFGIESGNEEILRLIKKNISLEQASKVADWCYQLGIKSKGFFIIGHPGETIETIDQTIETALRMRLHDVVVTLNTPLPATEQSRTAESYGTLEKNDWAKFNMWNPVFIPFGLSREIMEAKHREFYRRFYLRPKPIFRYMMSFFSTGGLRRAVSLIRTVPFMFRSRAGVDFIDDGRTGRDN